jgi:LPXTG-motif cell wall-anchored protein
VTTTDPGDVSNGGVDNNVDDGTLPRTGTDIAWLTMIGTLATASGAVILVARRRAALNAR